MPFGHARAGHLPHPRHTGRRMRIFVCHGHTDSLPMWAAERAGLDDRASGTDRHEQCLASTTLG
eukprot:scaffold35739_cov112-Isochrysis_galbana.AAC.3